MSEQEFRALSSPVVSWRAWRSPGLPQNQLKPTPKLKIPSKKKNSPQFCGLFVRKELQHHSLPGAARTLCLAQALPGQLPLGEGWCHLLHPPSPTVGIFPSPQQYSLCLKLSHFPRNVECCCRHGSVLLGGDQLNKVEKTTLTVSFSKYKSPRIYNQKNFQGTKSFFFHPSISELSKQPYLQSQLGLITFPGLWL